MDKKNTTILVKKDDGTSVRMTMAEFLEYKKNKKTQELATTTPTKDYFIDRAMASKKSEIKKWTPDDHRSPLEEQFDIPKKENVSPLPASYDEQISTIANQLSFSVPTDLQGRFRSLLTLRLKRLRTDDEVEAAMLENSMRGGLGLTPKQAEELRLVIDVMAPELPSLKMKPRPAPIRPTLSAPPLPSRPSPVKVSPPRSVSQQQPQSVRTTIQDITTERPEKKTVSPIDELRLFTLQNFRHLSANPKEATDIVLHKLTLLQQESYLLYIDGLAAFLTSPFYRQYQTIIQSSLNTGKPVQTLCSEPSLDSSLTCDEFMAVVEMRGKMI